MMKVRIEYVETRPADFQVYRVHCAKLDYGYWLHIDFSDRVVHTGEAFEDDSTGLDFELDGERVCTIWFTPESSREDLHLHGSMCKKTFSAVWMTRKALLDASARIETLHAEEDRSIA